MEPRVMSQFFACCFQVSHSTGYFELQLISVENINGELADGECCDGSRNSEDLRCTRDECDTYFQICLKEYQTEVIHTGTCIYGSGSTQVLGGNTFSLKGAKNNPNKIDEAGKILISFQFAWPVSGDVFTQRSGHFAPRVCAFWWVISGWRASSTFH